MFKFKTGLLLAGTVVLFQSSMAFAETRCSMEALQAGNIYTSAIQALTRKEYALSLSKWDELKTDGTLWEPGFYYYRAKSLAGLGRYNEALNDLALVGKSGKKQPAHVRKLQAKCRRLLVQDPLRLGNANLD